MAAPSSSTARGSARGVVLAVMCTGYFLVLLDVTIVNVALPHMRSGLHASVAGLQWVVDGYAIALASTMLGAGTFGDLFGHKRVVVLGFGVFGAASLACALAPTTAALVAARVVQGAGAAMLLPGTLAIVTRTYSESAEQARAIGIWAGLGSAALPAGPLLGGALVQALDWRAVFFLNVPIVLAAGLLAVRVAPDDHGDRGRQLDSTGTALAALLLASITFTLIDAGESGFDLTVGLAAAVAVALFSAFLAVERRASDPMLPLQLFRRPAFSTANAAAASMNLVMLGTLFVLTLYIQSVQGRSALEAGLWVLPLFLPLVVLAPLVGRVIARIGPRMPMVAGLLLAAAGLLVLAGVGANASYSALVPPLLLLGIGMGFLTPAVVAGAMGSVPRERAGLAAGVNNTARQAGGAIGVAAFGAIAGSPAHVRDFMTGMHTLAFAGAGLWLVLAVVCGAPVTEDIAISSHGGR